jgi:hypothetical protein
MPEKLANEFDPILADGTENWNNIYINVLRNEGMLQPIQVPSSTPGKIYGDFFVQVYTEAGVRYLQFQEFSSKKLMEIFIKKYTDKAEIVDDSTFRCEVNPNNAFENPTNK